MSDRSRRRVIATLLAAPFAHLAHARDPAHARFVERAFANRGRAIAGRPGGQTPRAR